MLEVGGGVLEPLVLAALVRVVWTDATVGICALDPSRHVFEALAYLAHDSMPGGDQLPLFVDAHHRRLRLDELAHRFAPADHDVNLQLTDEKLLLTAVQELAALGVLPGLGLALDPQLALRRLMTHGPTFVRDGSVTLTPLCTGFLQFEGQQRHDAIISNFSTQFLIADGAESSVAHRFLDLLQPWGILEHAAAYSAQIRLLRALCSAEPALRGVFAVRDADRVVYLRDPAGTPPRLRIRTDLLAWQRYPVPSPLLPQLAPIETFPSLPHILETLDPEDGLAHERLALAFWSLPDGTVAAVFGSADMLLAQPARHLRLGWRHEH